MIAVRLSITIPMLIFSGPTPGTIPRSIQVKLHAILKSGSYACTITDQKIYADRANAAPRIPTPMKSPLPGRRRLKKMRMTNESNGSSSTTIDN